MANNDCKLVGKVVGNRITADLDFDFTAVVILHAKEIMPPAVVYI